MLVLSLSELKLVAKIRGIKGYKACLKRGYEVLLMNQNQ